MLECLQQRKHGEEEENQELRPSQGHDINQVFILGFWHVCLCDAINFTQ